MLKELKNNKNSLIRDKFLSEYYSAADILINIKK